MTDKTKRSARGLQQKTGMSYQAALNVVRRGPTRRRPAGRFEAVLRRVSRLATSAKREYRDARPHEGPMSAAELLDLARAPRPKAAALHQFLDGQSMDDIRLLVTVMYFGRDYNPEPFAMYLRDHYWMAKDVAVVTMLGKDLRLGAYLRRGITALKRQGFNVERLSDHVSSA